MVDASLVHIAGLRGRAREREAITTLLAGAAAGCGGALLLHGDPGIGKTALLEYAAGVAAGFAAGFAVLGTAGAEDEAAIPYAGLHRLLQPVLDRAPAEIRGAVGTCDRLRIFAAVLDLLTGLARERPVLCRIDDAHGLDPASRDALAFAARRLQRRPIAIVFAASTEAALPGIPSLRLIGLDPEAARELLGQLPAGAADALIALARGNPQALVDLAAVLTAAQRAGEAPPPATLPAEGALARGYRARLARLPADTRWLLLVAAAGAVVTPAGDLHPDDGLDAAGLMSAAGASGVDLGALAPAELAGLIRIAGTRVTFPEPLARAVAYEDAPLVARRAAHLLLARTLDPDRQRLRRAVHLAAAAYGPDPGLAAELEDAAVAGGGYATASAALERAAQLTAEPVGAAIRLISAARYAWLSGHPHQARTLLHEVRPPAANLAVAGQRQLLTGEIELRAGAVTAALGALLAAADALADSHRELAIGALMRAGEAICFAGDHFRYADIARRADRLRRPAPERPDEPAREELMFAHIAGFAATFRGRHREAVAPLRRAIALGTELDEPAALTAAGAAALLLADDGAAYRLSARAAELARATGDASVLPRALELLACAEYWLGRYDAATATSLEGLRTARSSGQHNCAGNHLATLAVLAAVRGDRHACLHWIGELPVPQGAEMTRPRALSEWALAMLAASAGRPADAVARLRAIANPGTGRGHVVVQVMATPCLIEAAARTPERAAVLPALEVFDRWAGATANPGRRALSARCHALLAPPGSAAAEDGFREALRLHLANTFTAGESDFERARTDLLFGQELRRRRRPRDAREHLHRALETFQRFGARSWAERTAAELRATGEAVPAPAARVTVALTAQQRLIARLVAEGATNREVAAQLFLSPRTVDHHMRNIFSRLGIRSRIELAKLFPDSPA